VNVGFERVDFGSQIALPLSYGPVLVVTIGHFLGIEVSIYLGIEVDIHCSTTELWTREC
jgi:hypothetical protein